MRFLIREVPLYVELTCGNRTPSGVATAAAAAAATAANIRACTYIYVQRPPLINVHARIYTYTYSCIYVQLTCGNRTHSGVATAAAAAAATAANICACTYIYVHMHVYAESREDARPQRRTWHRPLRRPPRIICVHARIHMHVYDDRRCAPSVRTEASERPGSGKVTDFTGRGGR